MLLAENNVIIVFKVFYMNTTQDLQLHPMSGPMGLRQGNEKYVA